MCLAVRHVCDDRANLYNVGVSSVTVAVVTGMFLGMVLAVEAYAQFHPFGFDAAMGTITCSCDLEASLGAGAGRRYVGWSGRQPRWRRNWAPYASPEQIDALVTALGVDPVYYLATPRFLACLLLIPLLTVISDASGDCRQLLYLHLHLQHRRPSILGTYPEVCRRFGKSRPELIKSTVFGCVLSLVSSFRGFRSKAGAEGVGRAATEAFVYLFFLVILVLDFFLAYSLNALCAPHLAGATRGRVPGIIRVFG